jgi:hypothetical protein
MVPTQSFSIASFQISTNYNYSFKPKMSSSQYFVPDLLVSWPWQRILNPALAEVKDDSNAWVKSLELFEQAQLRKFNACDFSTCDINFRFTLC